MDGNDDMDTSTGAVSSSRGRHRGRVACLLLTIAALLATVPSTQAAGNAAKLAPAQPPPAGWEWQPTLVPHALLLEGLWTDTFRLRGAVHAAGLPYAAAYKSSSAYWRPMARLFGIPGNPAEYQRFAVIVISNVDAGTLTPERLETLRRFVENGGGLVVLGGYWAYSRGAYQGTPFDTLLPVTYPEENRIPGHARGLPLAAAPAADWEFAADFTRKPCAFYVQNLVPKAESRVQLLAGEKPAIVSGTFGKGRVVACALTANGVAPYGVLAYWDWPDWPQLLGQAIDWAAGVRPLGDPLAVKPVTSRLTEEESEALTLGEEVSAALVRQASVAPTAEEAEALLALATRAETKSSCSLKQLLPVIRRYAVPEWGARLAPAAAGFNPDPAERRAALILLGASRAPEALAPLKAALRDKEVGNAALEGLGLLGNPEALPWVRPRFTESMRAAASKDFPDDLDPELFAGEQAETAAMAALALYRLGDADGVARLARTYAQVRLLHRVLANAGKRRVLEKDVQGVANAKRIWEITGRIGEVRSKLEAEAGPVPATQAAAFIKGAAACTDEAELTWFALAMEQSAGKLPPATWKPLTSAKDGILARLATALSRGTP